VEAAFTMSSYGGGRDPRGDVELDSSGSSAFGCRLKGEPGFCIWTSTLAVRSIGLLGVAPPSLEAPHGFRRSSKVRGIRTSRRSLSLDGRAIVGRWGFEWQERFHP